MSLIALSLLPQLHVLISSQCISIFLEYEQELADTVLKVNIFPLGTKTSLSY